ENLMAASPESKKFRVSITGLDDLCRAVTLGILPREYFLEVPYNLEKMAEASISPEPVVLIFGQAPEGVNLNEVAQVARMQHRAQPIYYVTSNRTNFDRKSFQQNGFTDAFLIPIDTDTFTHQLRDDLAKASKGAYRSYRPVHIMDIQPNETLRFDTYMYMPVNKKHIRISASGDSIDETQHAKLTQNQINSIHVTSDQIQAFYDFTAQKLRVLQKGDGLSETEKSERMKSAIRNLMASVFNDSSSDATLESGRNIVADCQNIVKSFIVSGDAKNSWYEKMLAATGSESGSYNHAGNVATFGALFSLAVGIGKPEDIALAGLLHDMGLADTSPLVQQKPAELRTKEEEE